MHKLIALKILDSIILRQSWVPSALSWNEIVKSFKQSYKWARHTNRYAQPTWLTFSTPNPSDEFLKNQQQGKSKSLLEHQLVTEENTTNITYKT